MSKRQYSFRKEVRMGYAANGRGLQSPIMVLVKDRETIEKLSKMNAKIMGASKDPFYGAPVVVIVLADKNCRTYVEDGSLVMGNLKIPFNVYLVNSHPSQLKAGR